MSKNFQKESVKGFLKIIPDGFYREIYAAITVGTIKKVLPKKKYKLIFGVISRKLWEKIKRELHMSFLKESLEEYLDELFEKSTKAFWQNSFKMP